MLILGYPSTGRKDLSDYSKKATCKPFHSYIDEHSQLLIDEYPGYGVQAIIILQYQCENMTIVDQIIYNRLFQQLIPKWGEPEINYIKIFHNANALVI